jgi:hypothetical protein
MAPAGLDTGRPHSKPPRDVDKLSPSGACNRVVAGAFYCLRDEPPCPHPRYLAAPLLAECSPELLSAFARANPRCFLTEFREPRRHYISF